MERLAHRDDKGWYIAGEDGDRLRGAHVDRLAAYEDTEFEPEDISDFMECWKKAAELGGLVRQYGIDHLRELVEAEQAGRLVVLNKDYTDKDGEEALGRAMWECGHTNNTVTRYTADAIAEKLVREEAKATQKTQEVK